MPRKPKFKPVITKIKLNPEQVVLACDCYLGHKWDWGVLYWNNVHFSIGACNAGAKTQSSTSGCQGGGIGLSATLALSGGSS